MSLRPRFVCLLLALWMVLPAAAYARRNKAPTEEEEKPKLSLTADPAFGYTPVTVILTGHLTGVKLKDPNFCHPAVTWVKIDPRQNERDVFKVREDPACVHPDEETSVPGTFTKIFDLYQPGS